MTMAGDGSHALLVLGFESTDHPVEEAIARALEICAEHGGVVPEARAGERDGAGGTDAAVAGRGQLLARRVPRRALRARRARRDRRARGDVRDGDHVGALRRLPRARQSGRGSRRCAEVCGEGGRVTCRFTHVYPDGPAAYFTAIAPARRGEEVEQWGGDQARRLGGDHRRRRHDHPPPRRRARSPARGTTRSARSRSRSRFARRQGRDRSARRDEPRRARRPARADRPGRADRAGRRMKIAVLGPGGVGGLLAGALERAGERDDRGRARVHGADDRRARACASAASRSASSSSDRVRRRDLEEPVDALIVATKAAGLRGRARADRASSRRSCCRCSTASTTSRCCASASLRRPCSRARSASRPTVPSRASSCTRARSCSSNMASRYESARAGMAELARALGEAGVKARGEWPISERSEAQVMWSKLVRLNALACTTSAYDKLLGEIRSTPALRADLSARSRRPARPGRPRAPRTSIRRRRSTSSSARTRRSAARCSATSRPGASPRSTRSPARCCARPTRHGLRLPDDRAARGDDPRARGGNRRLIGGVRLD